MFTTLLVMLCVILAILVLPVRARAAALSFNELAAKYAQQFIGAPYAWGGTGPGYDCSGLAMTVYARFGKELEHTAEWDYTHGKIISQAQAWGGDLVVFLSGGYAYHVGIYEGGNAMVSALDYFYGVKQTPISWGGPDYVFVTFSH
jgi:peptidoglycan DL-endopeptidase CwlO